MSNNVYNIYLFLVSFVNNIVTYTATKFGLPFFIFSLDNFNMWLDIRGLETRGYIVSFLPASVLWPWPPLSLFSPGQPLALLNGPVFFWNFCCSMLVPIMLHYDFRLKRAEGAWADGAFVSAPIVNCLEVLHQGFNAQIGPATHIAIWKRGFWKWKAPSFADTIISKSINLHIVFLIWTELMWDFKLWRPLTV